MPHYTNVSKPVMALYFKNSHNIITYPSFILVYWYVYLEALIYFGALSLHEDDVSSNAMTSGWPDKRR